MDRAEDAALLLEQGIDDNIIPNGMAVLIYFVVVPKTKRIERVTASKSSPTKCIMRDWIIFFYLRAKEISSILYDTLNIAYSIYLLVSTITFLLQHREQQEQQLPKNVKNIYSGVKVSLSDGGGRVPKGANGMISASLTSSSSRFGLRHVTRLDAGCQ